MTELIERQLDDIVTEYDARISRAGPLQRTEVADLRTRCIAAVERASGSTSSYYRNITEFRKKPGNDFILLEREMGVARAFLSDVRNGYLQSFEEFLHGDVFGDYLEMAAHLLDNKYKDAAAVITGSTLEVHIRKLCNKHNISVERDGKARKTDELNSELVKKSVYSKLDQKNVTAWLDLRNKAAHGHYSEYTKDQVALFLQGVRDFITRHAA